MNTENGAIYFESLLNNKQFDGAIAESERRVKGMSDATVAAGEKIDKTFSTITKSASNYSNSFQKQSKREVGLIADIEKELQRLKEAKNGAFTVEEIEKYNKKIQEAEQDLKAYNKAGLELGNVQDNNEKKTGFFSTALGKLAITAGVVAGGIKVYKAIMESTEGTMLKMESNTYGLKTALDSLLKTIASRSWSNFKDMFSGGIWDAFHAGKDYKLQMDVIENINRDFQLKEEDLNRTIEEQRRIFYEDDKTSMTDKIAAGDAMLTAMKKKADLEIELSTRTNRAVIDLSKEKNKISEEDLNFAMTNYSQIQEVGRNYEVIEKQIEKMKRALNSGAGAITGRLDSDALAKGEYKINVLVDTKVSEENLQKLEKLKDALGPDAKMYAEKLKLFDNLTSKEKDTLEQSALAVKKANNQYDVESKRVYRMQQNMQDQQAKIEEDAAKEKVNLQGQINTQIELLNKAVADGNVAEIKAIADRIVALQKEYDIRVNIAKAALLTSYGGAVPKITNLPDAPTMSVKPTLPGIQNASTNAQKGADLGKAREWNVINEEADKKAEESLKKQLELRQQIVQAVAELVSQIGQEIGLNEKSTALLNAGLSSFTQLAAGDLPGAAMSMLSGIIAQIPSSASRFEKQIDHINQLLEKQQRLIDQSEQKGGQAAAREGILTDLEIKAAAQKAEYERLQKSADKHWDLLGWRQDKADEAYATWQATTVEIENSNQALTDFYTNTTAASVADAIVQGFQDGKTSAADFADTFNGFMTNAIDSALKDSLLVDLRPWYEQFKIDMKSGGGLDDTEKADLKAQWDKIIAEGQANRDAAYKIAGLDLSSASQPSQGALKGSVKSLTEETGNELAGLFRRFADDGRAIKDYSKQGVNQLISIEMNTMNTFRELQRLNDKTDQVISNTKSVYSGNL